jgi:glycosyltransferase involved in cell wall biosynthesis
MAVRIGFDGRDLLRKRTGVVNYTLELARRLSQRADAEMVVYADGFRDPAVGEPTDVRLRRLAAPPVVWKHVALPLALLRDRADAFHSPTGTLPLVAPCPRLVTIHDLFADVGPEWFPPRMGRRLRLAQRRAARSASAILTVSHTTARDLVERYGVPQQRVHVVYNGVDHQRFFPREVDAAAVARRYGVPFPFVLFVGSLLPWRNTSRLLRAVARLRQRWRDGCNSTAPPGLLIVGRDIWRTDATRRLAEEQGWTDWARFAGYLPDDELPTLYAAAAVFAYPSLYDGFGIPPLEAMASGTPVVASTAGALPEVLGDAALLVDPTDEDGLADALQAALEGAADLRQRGLAQAARYSWDRAAEQTWWVYEQVVAGL